MSNRAPNIAVSLRQRKLTSTETLSHAMEVPFRNFALDCFLDTLSASLRGELFAMQAVTLPATYFDKPPCATREVHLLQFAGPVEAALLGSFCETMPVIEDDDGLRFVRRGPGFQNQRQRLARTRARRPPKLLAPRARRFERTNHQWITGYFTSTLSGSLCDGTAQRADKKDRHGGFSAASRQRQIFA